MDVVHRDVLVLVLLVIVLVLVLLVIKGTTGESTTNGSAIELHVGSR